ncbi:MAG: ABC transporter ATP-binding protein [Ruminiclostridium sp.]|nr:ABC transporter ATP-binding protein [Ruminiclostridium sp.]
MKKKQTDEKKNPLHTDRRSERSGQKRGKDAEHTNPLHKDYGLISNLRWAAAAIMRYNKPLLAFIALSVVCAPFMRYLWTFLSKFIIDLITGNGDTGSLLTLMLIFTGIQITVCVLESLSSCEWYRFTYMRFQIILEKNAKVMGVDFRCLEDPDYMDCYQKASNAHNNNDEGIEGLMRHSLRFLRSLAVTAVGIVILGTLNVWIMLGVAVLAAANFAVRNAANKWGKAHIWDPLAKWWRRSDYMKREVTDFTFAKEVRLFGLRSWLADKYAALQKERLNAQIRNEKLWFGVALTASIITAGVQLFVYIYLIYAVSRGDVTIGNFTLYVASSTTMFDCLNEVLGSIADLFQRSRQVDDLRSFMDFDGGDDPDSGKELPALGSCEFEFRNVSFKYPKAEKYALVNLSLTIRAGERLAVVGLNGAGKTTFIKLLLRLYEPTSGEILLNGVNVKEYSKRSWYRAFSPVFQDVELFAFPLCENVSMQSPEKTDKALAEKCLIDAGMGSKLKALKNGVSTEMLKIIHDDGVDLSGGEKQKLALARALYKNAPVVVLDEPTAALDALAESKLYSDFDKLIGGKTAVYISHRLSSTQFCSSVAMFKDGHLEEYGTHDELIGRDGAYAEMFRVQAQYYVDDVKPGGKEALANA